MKYLLQYLKPYIFQILIVLLFIIIQVQADLALPGYLSDIINKGVILQDNDTILDIGSEMLVVALIGAVATIIVSYFAARISTGVAKDIREGVYIKILGFSSKEIYKFSVGSLLTRSTNDIQQIQTVIFMFLRLVISAPILGIGAVFKAYQKAPDMSWLIGIAVVTILILIIAVFILAVPKFKILQNLIDKLNLVSRENLTGLRVIRAFNKEKYQEKKFDDVNKELTRINIYINKVMIILQPLLFLVLNLTSIGVVWFGAKLLNEGNLEVGDMLAFMQYAMQVIMSFLMLTMVIIFLTRSLVSIKRLVEIFSTKNSVKDPQNPKDFNPNGLGNVEYRNVSFSYEHSENPVLKDISFVANRGEITAFVGSTGSGKSTLVNLLPRFYDVTKGSILIDNIDIREVKQSDLRDRIGYVPQKGYLFSGTIKSNLEYGKGNATEQEMISVSKTAQAYDFISKYKREFNNRITQGGTNVSGGQKQRISIARALIKNPDIYIFDDSFSALDMKTDFALRKALSIEIKGSTVLIVAQKISTILHADKIIVLDEGKLVGEGTHEQLLKSCKVYKEIALSQLSAKELKIKKKD